MVSISILVIVLPIAKLHSGVHSLHLNNKECSQVFSSGLSAIGMEQSFPFIPITSQIVDAPPSLELSDEDIERAQTT